VPTLDTSLVFLGAALLLALTPGPDNLFVLMESASNGRRAGLLVVLGLCTGLVGHTLAVAFGLAAVFAASAAAFTVLKYAGAAYLAWLAWGAWRAPAGVAAAAGRPPEPAGRLYLRGVVMNLTNPQVVLFFLAFLPQFVQPEAGPVVLQLAWFGGLFIVATLVVFGAIAWFAGYFGERLRRSERGQRVLNRASAVVFAGLAVRLATSRR
jgi:threonine/homoserine/homoserine lactone efflux protein